MKMLLYTVSALGSRSRIYSDW